MTSHLHRDDYPTTLALLGALIRPNHRRIDGFEPTETGAFVDWDTLATGVLPTTERATVHIARGLAIYEWCGPSGPLTPAIHQAATEILRGGGR